MPVILGKVKGAVAKSIRHTTHQPVSMTDLDRAVNERTGSIRAESARGLYVAHNMMDLPEIYRSQMPAIEDSEALAAAEGAIRNTYKADVMTHMPYQTGYSQVNGDPSEFGPPRVHGQMLAGRAQAIEDQRRAASIAGSKAEKPAEVPPPDPKVENWDNLTPQQLIAKGILSNSQAKPVQTTQAVQAPRAVLLGNDGLSASANIAMGLRGMK